MGAMIGSLLLGAEALLNLSGKLCGPPRDVISSVESRGYVAELELSTIIPAEIATRHDLVILFFFLSPEKVREEYRSTGGVFSQRMIRVIRSDREAARPLGWACLYDETPIMDQHLREMLDRARRVDDAIRSNPAP